MAEILDADSLGLAKLIFGYTGTEWQPIKVRVDGTISHEDPTTKYKFSDNTATGDPQYFGYVTKDQDWYIMKLTASGARFAKGSGNYAANFSNAANLTYYYFFELSW